MIKKTPNQGFSLIELLVSLTIFSVVVTMTTGTLLILIDANAKAQNMQSIINNVTFALDSMTREIRTGYSFNCSSLGSAPGGVDTNTARSNCTNANYISIMESGGSLTASFGSSRIAFYFDDDYYGAGQGAILRKLANQSWFPITSKNVTISSMLLNVTGTSAADNLQPSVTIFIEGQSGDFASIDTSFNIQTTVVQRLLDI